MSLYRINISFMCKKKKLDGPSDDHICVLTLYHLKWSGLVWSGMCAIIWILYHTNWQMRHLISVLSLLSSFCKPIMPSALVCVILLLSNLSGCLLLRVRIAMNEVVILKFTTKQFVTALTQSQSQVRRFNVHITIRFVSHSRQINVFFFAVGKWLMC